MSSRKRWGDARRGSFKSFEGDGRVPEYLYQDLTLPRFGKHVCVKIRPNSSTPASPILLQTDKTGWSPNPPQLTHNNSGTSITGRQLMRTVNLPQDLLEIIIANLRDDTSSLKNFSATCYSWYLAATPHLYNALTLDDVPANQTRPAKLKPLAILHEMDLLRFVKKLHLQASSFDPWLSPKLLDQRTLQHFFALTNVQQLQIKLIDLTEFLPGAERYFGHHLPRINIRNVTSNLAFPRVISEPRRHRRQVVPEQKTRFHHKPQP